MRRAVSQHVPAGFGVLGDHGKGGTVGELPSEIPLVPVDYDRHRCIGEPRPNGPSRIESGGPVIEFEWSSVGKRDSDHCWREGNQ